MKTLNLESVNVGRFMGQRMVNTVFNTTDKESPRYFDIAKLSGRPAFVSFSFTEDNVETQVPPIVVPIPPGLDELGVKSHIITFINNMLGGNS